MRISTVLHPEVTLGRRGEAVAHKFYRAMFSALGPLCGDGRFKIDTTKLAGHRLAEIAATDGNMWHHIFSCKRYHEFGGRSYYIPKDFALALSKIDRGMPISVLPDKFVGYFHFPEKCFFDDDGEVLGGYVFLGKGKYLGLDNHAEDTLLSISYVNIFSPVIGMYPPMKFCEVAKEEKIEEMLRSAKNDDPKTYMLGKDQAELHKTRLPIFCALINAAIYVHSQDPELLKLRPISELTHSKRPEYKKISGGNVNECTIPVTLLNWSYGQGRSYSVDSTMVQTHMRWQPCGPGHSQVKLIWVKEHERHYKKEEEHDQVQHEQIAGQVVQQVRGVETYAGSGLQHQP